MKHGNFVYMMPIPVTVYWSDDGEGTTIDCCNIPKEDDLYDMLDEHAKQIKEGVPHERVAYGRV